jgi:hypothetical protein
LLLDPSVVRDLEGVLSRCPIDTIGVVVVPFGSGFSLGAIKRARTSNYNIILTDENNLCLDINLFLNNYQTKDVNNYNLIYLFFFIFNTFLLSLLLMK